MNYRVLIVGYRGGISEALDRLGIAHGVWHNKPLSPRRQLLTTLVRDFPRSREGIIAVGDELAAYGPFTHVIAGSEAAVYPASVLRRRLGARLSRNTMVLRCHDKLRMKEHLQRSRIPMTDFIAGGGNEKASRIFRRLGIPVVVKSRQQSGGRQIVFADNESLLHRFNNRNKILERYIDAPEVSVETFINQYHIRFENITQYYVKGHVNVVPALLTPTQQQALLEFNRGVIGALNIKWGVTHTEMYLSEAGILFGEIALRAPGGYLMELISASYEFNAWDALVAMELDLPFSFPHQPRACSAACVFHPGAGLLERVENWDQALSLPGVFRAQLKRQSGDCIEHRGGVGEDIGYLLLKDAYCAQLMENVDWVLGNVRFVLDAGGCQAR